MDLNVFIIFVFSISRSIVKEKKKKMKNDSMDRLVTFWRCNVLQNYDAAPFMPPESHLVMQSNPIKAPNVSLCLSSHHGWFARSIPVSGERFALLLSSPDSWNVGRQEGEGVDWIKRSNWALPSRWRNLSLLLSIRLWKSTAVAAVDKAWKGQQRILFSLCLCCGGSTFV